MAGQEALVNPVGAEDSDGSHDGGLGVLLLAPFPDQVDSGRLQMPIGVIDGLN